MGSDARDLVGRIWGLRFGDFVLGELQLDSGSGVVEMLCLGHSHDRCGHDRIARHPREADLRTWDAPHWPRRATASTNGASESQYSVFVNWSAQLRAVVGLSHGSAFHGPVGSTEELRRLRGAERQYLSLLGT